MIIFCRPICEKMQMYEAFLRRINMQENEYGVVKVLYKNAKKGYLGELRADREWLEMQIRRPHYLFHNYESVNQFGHSHQIDTLFVCQHFILIIEIKDIGGRLDFEDDVRQMVQTKADGTKTVYENPTDQVLRHRAFIETELTKLGVDVPVIPLIVFTDPKTWIVTPAREVDVFRLSGLRSKLNELFEKYPIILGLELLDYIKEHLVSCYQKRELKRTVPKVPLVKGIVCSFCRLQMVHERKGFRCIKCGTKITNGIYEALHDYRLLYKDWITNQEFRDFFGVESIYTASRMLSKLGMDYTGNFKNRKYLIPSNVLELANK